MGERGCGKNTTREESNTRNGTGHKQTLDGKLGDIRPTRDELPSRMNLMPTTTSNMRVLVDRSVNMDGT